MSKRERHQFFLILETYCEHSIRQINLFIHNLCNTVIIDTSLRNNSREKKKPKVSLKCCVNSSECLMNIYWPKWSNDRMSLTEIVDRANYAIHRPDHLLSCLPYFLSDICALFLLSLLSPKISQVLDSYLGFFLVWSLVNMFSIVNIKWLFFFLLLYFYSKVTFETFGYL